MLSMLMPEIVTNPDNFLDYTILDGPSVVFPIDNDLPEFDPFEHLFEHADSHLLRQDSNHNHVGLDWRLTGCAGEVKDQQACSGCWAFAATSAAELLHCLSEKKISDIYKNSTMIEFDVTKSTIPVELSSKRLELSTQYLLDCETSFSFGCNGGRSHAAIKNLLENGVIPSSDYPQVPYKPETRHCEVKPDTKRYPLLPSKNDMTKSAPVIVSRIKMENNRSFILNSSGELQESSNRPLKKDILKAALRFGPVLASVAGYTKYFRSYKGGIMQSDELNCPSMTNNHAVLIIGYGIDQESKEEYFTIQNSYGPSFGLDGFIKMKAEESGSGVCGLYAQLYLVQYEEPDQSVIKNNAKDDNLSLFRV